MTAKSYKRTMYTTADNVKLRKSPTTDSEQVALITDKNTKVKVTKIVTKYRGKVIEPWMYATVKIAGKSYRGYVCGNYLVKAPVK